MIITGRRNNEDNSTQYNNYKNKYDEIVNINKIELILLSFFL